MNKNKRYDHEEMQRLIEKAHRRASGGPLGDVKINFLIKQNAWLFSEFFNKELSVYGLNCVGYAVLLTIYSTSDNIANPSDVCVCTGETRANMTRICDELVERGWVTRIHSPVDRRRIDLSLTEEGISLLDQAVPAIHKKAESVFNVFNAQEKAALESALIKLMHVLETK